MNFAASVDGYSETFATRWETRASATHPGFTRAFPKSAPFECDTSSKSGSSASSRRSARRSVSTRALTRMATRDLPLSTATTSPGECTSKPSWFNSWFRSVIDSSFPRSSPFLVLIRNLPLHQRREGGQRGEGGPAHRDRQRPERGVNL